MAGLVTCAVVIGLPAPVSAQTIGVVLMHGNTDSPSGTIALLAAAMEGASEKQPSLRSCRFREWEDGQDFLERRPGHVHHAVRGHS